MERYADKSLPTDKYPILSLRQNFNKLNIYLFELFDIN
jgi:hypothetical protein